MPLENYTQQYSAITMSILCTIAHLRAWRLAANANRAPSQASGGKRFRAEVDRAGG